MTKLYNLTKQIHELLPQVNKKYNNMDYISHLHPGYLIYSDPECHSTYPDVVVSKIDYDHVQDVTGYWSIQHDGRNKEYYVYTASSRFSDKKSLEGLNGCYIKTSYDSNQVYVFNYSIFLEELKK